jgi:osmotically-inducible protein OsmY
MAELTFYPISDLRIRVEVQDRLQNIPGLDASDVDVKVDHCEVRLGGVVWSDADALRVEAVAAAVDGVKRVRNGLLVQARRGGVGTGFLTP